MSEKRRETRVERNHYLRRHPSARYGILAIIMVLVVAGLNFQVMPNINTYINSNHFKYSGVEKINSSSKQDGEYRYNKPEGIVVQSTAHNISQIKNDDVHAIVDQDQVMQLKSTQHVASEAGRAANHRYIQVELCQAGSLEGFAKGINNEAIYVASLLHKYHLKPTRASITQHNWSPQKQLLAREDAGKNKPGGMGTVWSESEVNTLLGGTKRTDPDDYFSKYGYDMGQFYDLVCQYYYGREVHVPAGLAMLNNLLEYLRWIIVIVCILVLVWLLLMPADFWS